MLKNILQLNIIKLLRNCFSLMKYDLHKVDNELKDSLNELKVRLDLIESIHQEEIRKLKIESIHQEKILQLKFKNILQFYNENPDLAISYNSELSYLKENGPSVFPYKQLKSIGVPQAGFDYDKELPYVIHNGKMLFFPNNWSIEQSITAYKEFIESENILGGGYRVKSPHQYQTETFQVLEGDVVLDVGCAEALFSLDVIDKVKKIYLFESDIVWISALKATFEPYKDKVQIINKLVSEKDTDSSITLATALKQEDSKNIFIKMDIEGYEVPVILESEIFLRSDRNIKLVCCTYHRQKDAIDLQNIFTKLNYQTEFSEGYMLFIYHDDLKPPYFRNGLIRAKNRAE